MMLKSINPTKTAAWKKLEELYQETKNVHMRDWFKADPNRFDLVISDMTMPGMSGVTLSENLKNIKWLIIK